MARIHHNLLAWQEGIVLTKMIYKLTDVFPQQEQYGLTSQMRRAAVSVPSNIAEGAGRGSGKEFIRFLVIARASLSELETQLILAKELNYINEAKNVLMEIDHLFRLISGLIKSLKNKESA